jgi:hypothetical protein
MYSSVSKTKNKHKHENGSSGCRYRNDVAETTDPIGLLSRQGPGRGNVGLVEPYRASCDKLNTMGDREDIDDDGGGDPRSDRRGSEGNCVGVSGVGVERRMFMLRDEELVEDSDVQEYVNEKARKVSPDDGEVVSDVSPTPGRENWRLRESKSTTGDIGSGMDERRGMSMTDIWPKDWGGKIFLFIFLVKFLICAKTLTSTKHGYRCMFARLTVPHAGRPLFVPCRSLLLELIYSARLTYTYEE